MRKRKRIAGLVSRRSRRAKLEWIRERIKPGSTVLVVGVKQGSGRVGTSNLIERGIGEFAQVHALVYPDGKNEGDHVDSGLGCPTTYGDARNLPFADKSFDYVFSNAVIEHVGGPAEARAMLAESRRVARLGAFHTTPDRWFPIETHTRFPLIHWFPRAWQPFLFRRVGRPRWTATHWLYGRGEFSRLDPHFRIERPSFVTLVATWRADAT